MNTREVFDTWKEISAYLGRDVRTCRRWETDLGLPVHRLDGSPKARVRAFKDEIDRWLEKKFYERETRAHPLAALRRWPVVTALVALLVLFVIYTVAFRRPHNGHPIFVPPSSRPAIAVLPSVNHTGDDGLNYLCESLPDHIIRDLQYSAERLLVFSLDAVVEAVHAFELEPGEPLTPNDLTAIASRIDARWFLTSWLTKSGSKLYVNYELSDLASLGDASGKPVSASLKKDRVAGTEADVLRVVDRIVSDVRRFFGVPTPIGPGAFVGCSGEATRFYELARSVERKYTLTTDPADLEKMLDYLARAREADPGCALVYLGLGDANQHKFVYEDNDPEIMRLMKENYRRAYEMAPERAETNCGAGWIHFIEGDNDQAYAYFKKALEIDPASFRVMLDIGSFLRSIGLLEQGAEYYSRIILAGGTTTDVYALRGWTYEHMGLYEAALADYDRMVELEPLDLQSRCLRARVLVLMKRYDAAAAELATAESIDPGSRNVALTRALAAAARGERDEALAAIAPERIGSRPGRHSVYKSRVYAALGMRNEAVAAIELGIEKGFADVYDYMYFFSFLNNTRDYFYDNLRGDPRFAEILRREELKYVKNLEKYAGL